MDQAQMEAEIARLREFLGFITKDEHADSCPALVWLDECCCQPWRNADLAQAALEGLTLEQFKERSGKAALKEG